MNLALHDWRLLHATPAPMSLVTLERAGLGMTVVETAINWGMVIYIWADDARCMTRYDEATGIEDTARCWHHAAFCVESNKTKFH